jgi:predicted nucleotidyltransferase
MSLLTKPDSLRVDLPLPEIAEFCRKWRIRRLEVFGSALRDDFHTDSDLDFLYTFEEDAKWGWGIVGMREELAAVIGRPIDMVSRGAVEHSRNRIRRESILSNVATVYES